MPRATRNNSSGPLQSLPYGPTHRKRKAPPVTEEEEGVPVTEEGEGAATGRRGLGELETSMQEIREFNIPKAGRQDKPSPAPSSRPRKRARATTPEARSDDVIVVSVRKVAEPFTELDRTRSPTRTPGPWRSPRKSPLRDSVAAGAQETMGKPPPSAQNIKSRSSLAVMEAREKGLAEETERRIEEGIPSEDEEGGGARLSASHDPLQLKEKLPASRRTTLSSLRTEQVLSSSEDEESDLLPTGGSRESPEKVVEELMNSVVTSAITQADEAEEQEVEDPESRGSGAGSSPNDDEDVDEAARHQLLTEADGGANDEIRVRPERVASEGSDSLCEMSLADAFKEKLEMSREVLQTFKEQLKVATDTADQLMKLQTGHYRSGYTRILQEIVRKLAQEEHPNRGALEELADFARDINNIVSETKEAHRNVKALLEDLNTGIMSGTKSAWTVGSMLERKGFGEKASHDGINWKRINRNLVARENEVLVFSKPKPADPETPRRSARSNPSRYRTQGALPTPEVGPPPPAIPPSLDSLSDPESLGSTAPVIGDDAPVEVVRIESFGSRPSNTPRRSKRRRESEDDDSTQVREDRAWSSPELKALFRRLAQVQKAGTLPPIPHTGSHALIPI